MLGHYVRAAITILAENSNAGELFLQKSAVGKMDGSTSVFLRLWAGFCGKWGEFVIFLAIFGAEKN